MKVTITYYLLLVFMFACSSKKGDQEGVASQGQEEWPEMESFHMVMAEAYHPYKDSANFEPIKSLAENLAKESEKWAGAALPPAVDNENVKAKLDKLKTDCRSLADHIKAGATNEQIGTELTALHESFHGIMEEWHH
jgi:hypothetical protein